MIDNNVVFHGKIYESPRSNIGHSKLLVYL